MNPRLFAFTLFLGLTPAALSFSYEARGAGEETTTSMARARFKEGVEFYDKGQYDLARAAFLEAFALKKHPAVLLNLAWSCLKSGHVRESEQYFRQFLSEGTEISEKQRADANDGLHQARSKLGQIQIVAPAGTDATIDGERVTTPLAEATFVDPGLHKVVLKVPDGAIDTEGVTVSAGETAVARFVRPSQASAPAAPALPAQEEPARAAPPGVSAVPPEAARPPEAEERPSGSTVPETQARPSRVSAGLIIAGGIVTLAGVGTAIGMLVAKNTSQANANSTGSQISAYSAEHGIRPNNCVAPSPSAIAAACSIWNSDNKTVDTDALIGNVALGVGIAAAAGTAIYWIVAAVRSTDASTGATAIVPIVGRSTGGLALSGRW